MENNTENQGQDTNKVAKAFEQTGNDLYAESTKRHLEAFVSTVKG